MPSCINASKHNLGYLHQLFIRFSFHRCSPGLCQANLNSDGYAHKLPTRHSQFKAPQHSCTSHMIGPGTGIAPFHGLVRIRDLEKHDRDQ
ncbi:hypothetical protein G6F57_005194 [Rhizopus arrhizus]|uniref:Uncharacterized protein n=1 Tax=Rhizopus oryzae TaxID=64495 RepID=A0A9P6X683_RHIOR|nr:hypothetical protein G6F23_009149 [Rhizopus arrhizus]KAG1424375.1 hypothetical protein G6F58_002414 [Rhizopus delemar]KAG0760967.1 hypothetical protein G6F24_007914 [Rhizopus arrhizus]KAG0785345.1 hypothetical protein G6F22_007990 [Rhizopus arrhizus]KAG0787404.1 hypothetical protein G6F21_007924 [Rhizopus arrhizus]